MQQSRTNGLTILLFYIVLRTIESLNRIAFCAMLVLFLFLVVAAFSLYSAKIIKNTKTLDHSLYRFDSQVDQFFCR